VAYGSLDPSGDQEGRPNEHWGVVPASSCLLEPFSLTRKSLRVLFIPLKTQTTNSGSIGAETTLAGIERPAGVTFSPAAVTVIMGESGSTVASATMLSTLVTAVPLSDAGSSDSESSAGPVAARSTVPVKAGRLHGRRREASRRAIVAAKAAAVRTLSESSCRQVQRITW
jgi:hypothetical protein